MVCGMIHDSKIKIEDYVPAHQDMLPTFFPKLSACEEVFEIPTRVAFDNGRNHTLFGIVSTLLPDVEVWLRRIEESFRP